MYFNPFNSIQKDRQGLVESLSREEVDAIISAPDLATWRGRRDHAIPLTLYNSGARISEIAGLTKSQVMFGKSNFLLLKRSKRTDRTIVGAYGKSTQKLV
jgi:site-specific recombinase XerD